MENRNVKTERVTRELWVPHTRDQKAALADALAEASGKVSRYQDGLAKAKQVLGDRIKEAKDQQMEAVLRIAAEGDVAEVEVECHWDFVSGIYTEQRVDTGEIVVQREITAKERQEGLGLEGKAA